MIRFVGQKSVSQIFEAKNPIIYKIPKYQRAYTWGQSEWDFLFNDILENNSGYFLGSMICVRSENSSAFSNEIQELIDGQQRATSLSILLLAIYKKLNILRNALIEEGEEEKESEGERTEKKLTKEEKEELDSEIIGIRKQLVQKDAETGKNEPRIRLQIQGSNQDDYYSLLKEHDLIDGSSVKPANAGNRRIYKAYSHFARLIDGYLEDNAKEDAIKTLLKLYNKIDSTVVVMIEVESRSDAFMLFEALNFRGAKLNAIDLIKNTLMAAAENDQESDACYEKWQQIQERLGDEYAPQERFFRQYYNAFRRKLNEPFVKNSTKEFPLAYKATKSTLMNIYEQLIKYNYRELLANIDVASEKYEIITGHTRDDVSVEYSNELLNLERIQGAPSYMLLLYLEVNRERLGLSEKNLIDIAHLLVVFFVRRNITDYPNTRNLDQIFMDIIQHVKNKRGDEVVETIFETLVKKSSTDEVFEAKLRGPIYIENDGATRFILCYIENKHQTKETYSDLWLRDNRDKYIWTIEHIFPEGENVPDCWVRMINGMNENEPTSKDDKEAAKDLREKYTHTIGNLTMTGYNSNLSNKSFEEKKNRKNSEGNEIGYKNGLYLNNDVACEDEWTIEKVDTRTDKLVSEALELFRFTRD